MKKVMDSIAVLLMSAALFGLAGCAQASDSGGGLRRRQQWQYKQKLQGF